MIPYILKKTISYDKFQYYLKKAHDTNQFTNYGWAAKELEIRARDMLKIDESKAIIACSSGTAALHAMLWGIQRRDGAQRIGTQDFTFASNSLGGEVTLKKGKRSGRSKSPLDNNVSYSNSDLHTYG